MKAYKLVINKVHNSVTAILSSSVLPRTLISELYFLNKIDAEIVQAEKYKAAYELFGPNADFEATIKEIEIKETP